MKYNLAQDVAGELATSDGLVPFNYKAGSVTVHGDEAVFAHLMRLGLAVPEADEPVKKSTPKTAPVVEAPISEEK